MAKIRRNIENLFEAFAQYLYKYKFLMLILTLIIVILLASQIVNIKIDTSTEGFLHKKDPILIDYEEFRDQFGREEVAMVVLKPAKVFDQEFLKDLKSLHDDLEENLPFLEDITSLINARNTHGKKDELIVEDLFETLPNDVTSPPLKECWFFSAAPRRELGPWASAISPRRDRRRGYEGAGGGPRSCR